MKRLALAALSAIVGAGGCDSTSSVHATSEPSPSTPPGADPGAFLPSVCIGRDDVRAWRRVDPTTVNGEDLDGWRGSKCAWSVVMDNGTPIVFSRREEQGAVLPGFLSAEISERPSAVQKGRAGVLVGFDRGEWGGSLSWYSETGSLRRQLLDRNVASVLPAFGHFVALTYVGHGSEGRAVEVRDTDAGFEIGRTVALPGAPSAGVMTNDGSILIAAGRSLMRLSSDLQLGLVFDGLARHPVSLAIAPHQVVYVGMRGLVAELQLSTSPPTETWLYPF